MAKTAIDGAQLECSMEEFLGNPFLLLVYQIFKQALADCKDWSYHEDIKLFAKSAWCELLIMGAAPQEEIIEAFDREIEKAPRKRFKRCNGFRCKGITVNNLRLAEARREANLTQRKAAQAINVKHGVIAYWETPGKLVPKNMLKALCELYGYDVEYVKEIK